MANYEMQDVEESKDGEATNLEVELAAQALPRYPHNLRSHYQ